MAEGGGIAKAGWLHRQSSVLHRWKKNWFVLDRDGNLRFFETQVSPRAEERLVVRAVFAHIKAGPECRKADPPEGVSRAKPCFLELIFKDNHKQSLLLCAESMDDMKAWQIALEEARTISMPMAPHGVLSSTTIVAPPGYIYRGYGGGYGMGYGGYPGQIISPPPAQVINHPSGTTTIVQPSQQIVYVDGGPYRNRRYYRGGMYPTPMFFW